jgi:uncharacterized protein DUF1614
MERAERGEGASPHPRWPSRCLPSADRSTRAAAALHQPWLLPDKASGAPVASIGGAGAIDGVFLAGIIAVLLAGLR